MSSKIKKRSQWQDVWIRLRKNKLAVVGFMIMIFMIASIVIASFVFDYEEDILKQDLQNKLQPPSAEHWFGTDPYGRDLFARVLYGGRKSLFVGFAVVTFTLLIGGAFGAISGYYGGKVDNIIMRFMDVWLAIPEMLLAIAIVTAFGPGFRNLIIALVVAAIPKYARLVRASVMSVKGTEFIEAAKAVGSSDLRIILEHIIPNTLPVVIVQVTLGIGTTILIAAGLSFLGLGVKPPEPEWGIILAEGKDYIRYSPYPVLFPGLAIMLVVMSLNFIGDGLRDALDPKLKS